VWILPEGCTIVQQVNYTEQTPLQGNDQPQLVVLGQLLPDHLICVEVERDGYESLLPSGPSHQDAFVDESGRELALNRTGAQIC